MMVLAPRTDHNLTVAVMVEEEKPAAGGAALRIIRNLHAIPRSLNHFIITVITGGVFVVFSIFGIVVVHGLNLLHFLYC